MLPMIREVLSQATKKPVTNLFPAKYLPRSMTAFLHDAAAGRAEMVPPVASPAAMRGKLCYDRNACNGCGMCMKVCPAHAIEQVVYPVPAVSGQGAEDAPKPRAQKRVRIYVCSCIFCGQCIDVCPKGAISQSGEFLLAAEDRFAETQIVE